MIQDLTNKGSLIIPYTRYISWNWLNSYYSNNYFRLNHGKDGMGLVLTLSSN